MSDARSSVTIGLLWHSLNSGNLGVGALTVSNIAIIEKAAAEIGVSARFVILGWSDPHPFYFERPNIEVVALRMKDLLNPLGALMRHVRRCDLVLDIGAGDSFADIYGAHRIGTQLAAKIAVLVARRPLALSPQTIGPFAKPLWRRLSKMTVDRAAGVSTRDALSTAYLRDIGFRGEIVEATDVAMALPYDAPTPSETDKVRVGLNVSGLLFMGGYSRSNMFGLSVDYPAAIRRIVGYFRDRDDVELHLVGHVLPPDGAPSEAVDGDSGDSRADENDASVSAMIAKEYPGVIVAPHFHDPSSAKSYIASMDYFSGARMHACIAAFSTGVPVTPMAYSRKFEGLFSTLGYERTVDCAKETADGLFDTIVRDFEDRATLRAEVVAAMARSDARLDAYRAMLRNLLEAAA